MFGMTKQPPPEAPPAHVLAAERLTERRAELADLERTAEELTEKARAGGAAYPGFPGRLEARAEEISRRIGILREEIAAARGRVSVAARELEREIEREIVGPALEDLERRAAPHQEALAELGDEGVKLGARIRQLGMSDASTLQGRVRGFVKACQRPS